MNSYGFCFFLFDTMHLTVSQFHEVINRHFFQATVSDKRICFWTISFYVMTKQFYTFKRKVDQNGSFWKPLEFLMRQDNRRDRLQYRPEISLSYSPWELPSANQVRFPKGFELSQSLTVTKGTRFHHTRNSLPTWFPYLRVRSVPPLSCCLPFRHCPLPSLRFPYHPQCFSWRTWY